MFAVTWDVKIYALKAYFEWDNYVAYIDTEDMEA